MKRSFAILGFAAIFLMPAFAGQNDGETKDASRVALKFINEYADYTESPDYRGSVEWVKKSPLCTAEFKKRLESFLAHYEKLDPELGYGADPVVSSNGGVPRTFTIKSIKVSGERARAIVVGDASFPMELPVNLVKTSGQWLVDGSGDLAKQ